MHFNIHAYTYIKEGFMETRVSNAVEELKNGSYYKYSLPQ